MIQPVSNNWLYLNIEYMRLDSFDVYPSGMKEYLEMYGWHFNKKMCEWAVSNMKWRDDIPVVKYTKEKLDALLVRNSIMLKNSKGYDYVYAANMCSADFLNSSVVDEQHLAKYVKDVIEDVDAYEGMVFTRFYADCIGSGTPIMWEDML